MVVISVADRLLGFVTIFATSLFLVLGCLFNLIDIFSLLNLIQNLCFSHSIMIKQGKRFRIKYLQNSTTYAWRRFVEFLWRDATLLNNSITFTWKTMSASSFNFTGASTLRDSWVFSLINLWLISPSLSSWHHVDSVTFEYSPETACEGLAVTRPKHRDFGYQIGWWGYHWMVTCTLAPGQLLA